MMIDINQFQKQQIFIEYESNAREKSFAELVILFNWVSWILRAADKQIP